MRVLLAPHGTRGDVQLAPELGLAIPESFLLRADEPLFSDVDELRWRGPAENFIEWAERIEAPALVKRSVAGNGQAPKGQLARIVGAMLGWSKLPPVDATDALAIAITHAHAIAIRRKLP